MTEYAASHSLCTKHTAYRALSWSGIVPGAWASFPDRPGVDEHVLRTVLMNPDAATEEWIEYDRQRKHSRCY